MIVMMSVNWLPLYIEFTKSMNIEEVREYCIAKDVVTEEFPFDDVTLAFKVAGKMFAVICMTMPTRLILKCDPERAIELRELYPGIEPAWHFNKKYWNQHELPTLPTALVKELIDHSYAEVVAKMPKRLRIAVGLSVC